MKRPLLLAVLVALGWPATAEAHGVFPETERVAPHPSDPATLVVGTSFGLLVTVDAGASWDWICTDPTHALATEDPRVVTTGDGAIVVGVFAGLYRGEALGCSFTEPSPLLSGEVVIDLDQTPDGTLLAVTSSGGAANGVFRSSDEGRTWSAAGPAVDTTLFESIRIAPSSPSRVYLVGSLPPRPGTPRDVSIYRSNDGGASFETLSGPAIGVGTNLFLLGVQADDPDVLYAVERATEGDDRVLRSDDGGTSFVEVLRTADARAFASDGSVVWLGGRQGTGLFRIDHPSDVPVAPGPPFEVGCLGFRNGRLYACANEYADGWSLGASFDGGASFETLLTWQRVGGTRACPVGSPTVAACEPLEPMLEALLRPPPAPSGCRAAPARPSAAVSLLALCVALSLTARRSLGRGRPGVVRLPEAP